LGFTKSEADTNLYHIVVEGKLLIIVLYVDDLILTGDEKLVKSCKEDIAREFDMKEMGSCLYLKDSMPMRYLGDFSWRAINPWRLL